MPKFGTVQFGLAKFGAIHYSKFPDELSYHGYPLGLSARRKLAAKVIYRIRQGVQEKMLYYTPANPRTVVQQSWRSTFSVGVVQAKSLTQAERDVYREIAKGLPGQTWFSVFMSDYMWGKSHV